jgi:hypothetical protein
MATLLTDPIFTDADKAREHLERLAMAKDMAKEIVRDLAPDAPPEPMHDKSA